jgi:tetratricopeptide (TPR) repeat protein
MSMDLETGIKAALKDIEKFRTPNCLDETTLGRYVERKLDEPEQQAAEAHLHTCVYCLKQLNDMTELLHHAKQSKKLSPQLEHRLKEVLPENNRAQQTNAPSFLDSIKSFFDFNPSQWRYAALGLATAWVVYLAVIPAIRQIMPREAMASVPRDAFAKVQAVSDTGAILQEEQGVILASNGLIASGLKPLVGASKIQVTLRDGTTYQTDNIWKDENRNLAVMKIDAQNLKSIPTAEIKEITAGKKIFTITDAAHNGYQDGVISDFKELPSRKSLAGARYVQVATMTTTATRGAVVDEQGKLVGFIITEEKNINLAAPAGDITEFIKTAKQTPIKDLKQVNFSGKALNEYLQGILASDGKRWDEAIHHLKEAIRLNLKLEGAYIALGYAYYSKQDFKNEAEVYQALLKINPDNADALYSLAWNMESQSRYPEALPLYEKALAMAPKDTEILYQLGLSYLANSQKDKALATSERLKPLDPGQAEFLRRLIK